MQNIEFRLKDDYKDMIKILLEENVKFILVGGKKTPHCLLKPCPFQKS